MLAAKGDALAGLWIEGQKYFADGLKGEAREQDDFPVFVQAKEWLDRYFAGEKPRISEVNSGRRYGKPSARFPMAKS